MGDMINGFRFNIPQGSDGTLKKILAFMNHQTRPRTTAGSMRATDAFDNRNWDPLAALTHHQLCCRGNLVGDRDTLELQDASEEVSCASIVNERIETAYTDRELALPDPEGPTICVSYDRSDSFSGQSPNAPRYPLC